MGMEEYKDEFVSEARDHMDTLNECLLVLEKDSSDMDNINKTFRAFHTLKGNGATMGFKRFSELAHHLEDILDKVRNNELKVSEEIMNVIFEGVDILEEGLQKIEEDDSENIDSDDVMKKLTDILGKKEEVVGVTIGEHAHFDDTQSQQINNLEKAGKKIWRIIVIFDKTNPLKTAKSMILLRDLETIGELVASYPSVAEIKGGQFGEEYELVLATDLDKDAVSEHMNKVSGIKKDYVMTLEEKYEGHVPSEEEKHVEVEKEKHETTQKHKTNVVKQIQSVKVNMTKLDKLMNLIGELLIYNIRLQDIAKKKQLNELNVILKAVDRLTMELQDEIMEVRMVPIGNIFNRFPRMVRDLAGKEGKKVNLVMEGQTIEFDRTVLDQIGDPLVHLLRNSVDHGVEKPEQRIEHGKDETGNVHLIARREKNNAIIEITDDGEGIDPQIVKASCLKKGIVTEKEAEKMTDNQLQMLIFRPGVSTNQVITDVSGRGVGMDVVLTQIKQLGGVVKLESEVGKGTKVLLQLPLTLAIVTCLMVEINNRTYAIPLNTIERTVNVNKNQIKTIQQNEVFILRGIEIPLLWLSDLTAEEKLDREKYTVVIVNKSEQMIGLVVDRIIAQQQILIKGLQDLVKGTKGVSGATILGDGSVSLILDIESLLS